MEEKQETFAQHRPNMKMFSLGIMSVKGTENGQPVLWIGHIGQLRNCPLPLHPNDQMGSSVKS